MALVSLQEDEDTRLPLSINGGHGEKATFRKRQGKTMGSQHTAEIQPY